MGALQSARSSSAGERELTSFQPRRRTMSKAKKEGAASLLGLVVLYVLSETDAEKINRRRTTGEKIAARMESGAWPVGAQAHIGNTAQAGDVLPLLVTRQWEENMVNGQVFLDGNDTYWVTSAHEAAEAGELGTWSRAA